MKTPNAVTRALVLHRRGLMNSLSSDIDTLAELELRASALTDRIKRTQKDIGDIEQVADELKINLEEWKGILI